MRALFDGKTSVEIGQETVTYTEQKVKVGEEVSFFSRMGNFFGTKPIARGRVISACKDETGAPITPTATGKRKRNAWRFLYRIKITKIEE